MKKLIFVLISLFIGYHFIFSETSWPIKSMQESLISSHFGEHRTDHFHNGVDIAKNKENVYPITNGEVIFYWDYSKSIYPQELGLGKTIILKHLKFRSYYSHLSEIFPVNNYLVAKNQALGKIGNSGRSSGAHLHFSIKQGDKYINPALLLPKLKESTTPTIKSVLFSAGYYKKQILFNSKTQRIALPLRKFFNITVFTYDLTDGKKYRRSLKNLQVKISDSKGTIVFDKTVSFKFIENSKLEGKYSLKDIYQKVWNENFVNAGKWTKKERRETYSLLIIASDYSNNNTVFKRTLYFR